MMDTLVQFIKRLDPLVLALAGVGLALIILVVLTNAVQMRNARRKAARIIDAENAPMTSTDMLSSGRIEPSMGVHRELTPAQFSSGQNVGTLDEKFQPVVVDHALGTRVEPAPVERADIPVESESSATSSSAPAAAKAPAPNVDIELDHTSDPTQDDSVAVPLSPREPTAPIDGRVHSIVKLRFAAPLASEKAKHITDQASAHFKKSHAWVWSAELGAWSGARSPSAASHTADVIAFAMPLATRSGAVTETQLREWMGVIAQAGQAYGADVVYAPVHEDAKRAVELDQFCGNLDLMAGVSLMRPDRSAIPGTRIRGTLEAEGFRLLPEGHFVLMSDDGAQPIYDVRSIHGQPLSSEALRQEGVHGLALTLDVMRVANPVQQFDLMRALAKRLATRLEATIVDDRGHALTDVMFTQIRSELEKRVTAARTAGIEPGSPLARTLFGD